MNKKRSPKTVIQEGSNPKLEDAWAKLPLREPVNVAFYRDRDHVTYNIHQINEMLQKAGIDQFTSIHTHPVKEGFFYRFTHSVQDSVDAILFPSITDLTSLINNPREKTSVIAARGEKSGQVYGYLVIRKTKKTPSSLNQDFQKKYHSFTTASVDRINEEERLSFLKDALSTHHLRYKVIYAEPNLQGKKKLFALSSIFILGSLVFLSSNLTGYAVANTNVSFLNSFGVVLFLVGLIIAFLYFKSR